MTFFLVGKAITEKIENTTFFKVNVLENQFRNLEDHCQQYISF